MSRTPNSSRAASLLSVLLFAVSAIAVFYTGLAFALGDLWGSERGAAEKASGASALVLIVAIVVAIVSGIGARAEGRNANRAMVTCLVAGLIAALVPWIWTL